MLKLKAKFDLHRDVVCDILRKEASVCRVKGEATLVTKSALTKCYHSAKVSGLITNLICY